MLTTTHHDALKIRGGRVIDPSRGRDEIADVAIVNGRVAESAPLHAEVIDARGWIVTPGLMDIHVHLREPGFTHKETIESGARAAAAGGFTYVACMPNTKPPIDSPDVVRLVLEKAAQANHCDVGPVACMTHGRSGAIPCDYAALKRAGAVAFSDDGDGVNDDGVMRNVFARARECDALLIQHCEYRALSAGGVMHLGGVSRALGLPGLDPRSEEAMIERDIALCREYRARYHVAHISTERAVELVRQAKKEGLPVTSEVCTHHLLLTDEACATADPNAKMHPPLRSPADVEACRQGLLDGTIDCIITDHAPHAAAEKAMGMLKAPAGIVGLDTAVGLAARAMVESGLADWPRLIGWFTTGPAAVLNRPAPSICVGEVANLSLIHPSNPWTVNPDRFESLSRNTPFGGWTLQARPMGTVRGSRWTRPSP